GRGDRRRRPAFVVSLDVPGEVRPGLHQSLAGRQEVGSRLVLLDPAHASDVLETELVALHRTDSSGVTPRTVARRRHASPGGHGSSRSWRRKASMSSCRRTASSTRALLPAWYAPISIRSL